MKLAEKLKGVPFGGILGLIGGLLTGTNWIESLTAINNISQASGAKKTVDEVNTEIALYMAANPQFCALIDEEPLNPGDIVIVKEVMIEFRPGERDKVTDTIGNRAVFMGKTKIWDGIDMGDPEKLGLENQILLNPLGAIMFIEIVKTARVDVEPHEREKFKDNIKKGLIAIGATDDFLNTAVAKVNFVKKAIVNGVESIGTGLCKMLTGKEKMPSFLSAENIQKMEVKTGNWLEKAKKFYQSV